jgi:hypothetical protein
MKNKAFILVAFVLLSEASYAGTKLKLGLRLSPTLSFAGVRDKDSDDDFTYSSNGVAGRAILGPMAEIFMTDNVSFGLGLWYTPKSVSLVAKAKSDGSTYSSSYNLQYLMVPVYLKFYTNPITPKMKLYFTLGGTLDVKIAEKAGANTSTTDKSFFNPIDASVMLGAGVEFALSESTVFFVGPGYNRGLLNVINPVNAKSAYDALAIKNNLVIRFRC